MDRVLLVGEAPNATEQRLTRPGLALTGASGRTIARLAGLDWMVYLRRSERVNLLEECPVRWDWDAQLKARLTAMMTRVDGRRVVLCGRNVAAAFGHADAEKFVWFVDRGAMMAVIPHPSGRNHQWNDSAMVARASAFLTDAFKQEDETWHSLDTTDARA